MKLLGVPSDAAESVWHLVEPLIEKAVAVHDGYDMDDVLEAILHRDMQLWLSVDDDNTIKIAWVTQIVVFPRAKSLQIMFMGGKGLRECASHLDELAAFARMKGCAEMGAICRRGLKRWFKAEDSGAIYMTRMIKENANG